MITQEDLNQQVQSLAKQGKFQTAADIIANWAYWDMVGRFDDPPTPQGEDLLTEEEADEIESELPPGLLRNKIMGEFGVRWGSQPMLEENDG